MDRRGLLNETEETQLLILDGRQSTTWTALPGIVTEVDLDLMTISVQPAIQGVTYDQANSPTYVKLPVLVDVPLVFPSGGGFTITFPIAVNDEVLVIFASRCIDGWWQLGGIQVPLEMRMHDLSDGFAIPGPKSQPNVLSGISATALQLRSNDGTIVFGPDLESGLYKFKNAVTSLDEILTGLNTALITFATGLNPTTLAAQAAALVTALGLITTQITELLE